MTALCRSSRAAAGAMSRRRSGVAPCRCSGFTIIELLASIGVIGLLVSLAVPAVQASRERARRLECLNHLKQLGLACESLHASAGVYPEKTRWLRSPSTGQVGGWTISPFARLLPWLDQPHRLDLNAQEGGLDRFDQPPEPSVRNLDVNEARIPVFHCPSDPLAHAGTNYRGCTGALPAESFAVEDENLRKERRAQLGYFQTYHVVRDTDFIDGRSHTVVFGEKLVGDRDREHFTPWRDLIQANAGNLWTVAEAEAVCGLPFPPDQPHDSFTGQSWYVAGNRNTFYNHVLTPNSSIPDCAGGSQDAMEGAFTARSLHAGGVNVVTADGAARFIADAISAPVWRALATLAGREGIENAVD